jgi:hypothetical protein
VHIGVAEFRGPALAPLFRARPFVTGVGPKKVLLSNVAAAGNAASFAEAFGLVWVPPRCRKWRPGRATTARAGGAPRRDLGAETAVPGLCTSASCVARLSRWGAEGSLIRAPQRTFPLARKCLGCLVGPSAASRERTKKGLFFLTPKFFWPQMGGGRCTA